MRAATIAFLSLAIGAAPAAAAPLMPSSNSGADQYAEAYPTAEGDRQSDDPDGTSPGPALGKDEAGRLQAAGEDGRAAARLAAATAPGAEAGADAERQGDGPAGADGHGAADRNPATAVVRRSIGSASSGGIGLLLPVTLAVTLLLAVGAAAIRLRRGRQAN